MSRNPCPHHADRPTVPSLSSPLCTLSCVIWAVGPSALPCAGAAPPQRPPPKPSLTDHTPSYQRCGSSKVPAANPIHYQMAPMAAGMKHRSRQPLPPASEVAVGPTKSCRHLEITVRKVTTNRTHTIRIRPFLARFSYSPTNIIATQKSVLRGPSRKKGVLRGPSRPTGSRLTTAPHSTILL